MGSGKQYMHSINIGNSSDDVLKEPTKKDRITHKEGTASQHRRGVAEGTISLNVGMRFKNA